jgi:bacterioferritin
MRGTIMKGDPKVIEYLNRGLRGELTAVNQYWLYYRLLDNWGYKDMAKRWREESIEEMHHADRFTDRILFIDGFPNMQVLDPCASARPSRRSSTATSPPSTRRARSISRRRSTAIRSTTASPRRCSRTSPPTRKAISTSSRRS